MLSCDDSHDLGREPLTFPNFGTNKAEHVSNLRKQVVNNTISDSVLPQPAHMCEIGKDCGLCRREGKPLRPTSADDDPNCQDLGHLLDLSLISKATFRWMITLPTLSFML
jgi:hypothetical protein